VRVKLLTKSSIHTPSRHRFYPPNRTRPGAFIPNSFLISLTQNKTKKQNKTRAHVDPSRHRPQVSDLSFIPSLERNLRGHLVSAHISYYQFRYWTFRIVSARKGRLVQLPFEFAKIVPGRLRSTIHRQTHSFARVCPPTPCARPIPVIVTSPRNPASHTHTHVPPVRVHALSDAPPPRAPHPAIQADA
jgi:hypothetical protein